MTTDKKTTDVKVVGVSHEVAAQVQATQAEDKKSANAIADERAGVKEDLKSADDAREAKQDKREEAKNAKATKDARFALIVDLLKAFIIGLPLIITAYGIAKQAPVLASIHGWVNSGMRIQLEEKYQVADELAKITMKPQHIETARLYKEQLAEHDRQQAKQDAKGR